VTCPSDTFAQNGLSQARFARPIGAIKTTQASPADTHSERLTVVKKEFL